MDLDAALKADQTMPANAAATTIDSAKLASAQAKLANLQGMQKAPKAGADVRRPDADPEQALLQELRARASYTYSRLVGNYEGPYQVEGDYFAPNGNNFYDTPDLYLNQRGRLPNDHPHQARVDGYTRCRLAPTTSPSALASWPDRACPATMFRPGTSDSHRTCCFRAVQVAARPPSPRLDLRFAYGPS